jgi:hypothetical protein
MHMDRDAFVFELPLMRGLTQCSRKGEQYGVQILGEQLPLLAKLYAGKSIGNIPLMARRHMDEGIRGGIVV